MSSENLRKQDVVPYLLAQLARVGSGESLALTASDAMLWLRRCWEVGEDMLPLTLVHDLGLLLLRGREFRFASSDQLSLWPIDERASRLAYEDRVLGRWALDGSLLEAHIAIAGMPADKRNAAVGHAVALALGRVLRNVEELPRGNPAHVRGVQNEVMRLLPTSVAEWPNVLDPSWSARVDDMLGACMRAMPAGHLLAQEDLWEIHHLEELPNDSARLALREIHSACARIGAASPAVVLRMQRRAREVPLDAEAPDAYPAGGFDAISTRGTFENLVRTEVAYVGEGKLTNDANAVDLFDVRYVESELLYYTRDESPLLDQRRTITFVIDRPAEMRHQHPRLPAQTLVLVEGIVLALHADLLRVFGPAGSQLSLVWLASNREDLVAAEEEKTLLGLTLASDVAHRRVTLQVAQSWAEVPEKGRIVFSMRPWDSKIGAQFWVQAMDASWAAGTWTANPSHWDGLRALVDELLVPPVLRRRKA